MQIFLSINKILRAENTEADKFSKFTFIAMPGQKPIKSEFFVEYLPKPSTE